MMNIITKMKIAINDFMMETQSILRCINMIPLALIYTENVASRFVIDESTKS